MARMPKSTMLYWPARVRQEQRHLYKKTVEDCERELRRLYGDQSKELIQRLYEVWLKMEKDREERGKVYLNDLYLTDSYNRLLEHFNECAKELGGSQEEITERYLIEAYEQAKETVEKYVPKGSVRQTFVVPSAVDAKQVVHHVWCLDGKEFSDRIWTDKRNLVRMLEKTLADSAARGVSSYQIATEIERRLRSNLYCAYRIARTETAHAQIMGQTEKYQEYGFTHGIFLADDPCDECGYYDGNRYTLKELQGMLPKHPNCTCSFLVDTEV